MADNITVKDASGSNVVMRSKDVGGGVESSITIPGDATGAIAWGTAGVANANVMTVQGIASGTAQPVTGTLTAVTAITNALPAGTNVIGHVIADSGSTTVVTQATGTNLHVVVDSGTISTSGGSTNSYTHIGTSTTTNGIKSAAGTLVRVVVNQTGTVASLITVYDNTTATGTVIAVIDGLTRTGNYDYDCAFATGLSVITTGTAAPDITVVWR